MGPFFPQKNTRKSVQSLLTENDNTFKMNFPYTASEQHTR